MAFFKLNMAFLIFIITFMFHHALTVNSSQNDRFFIQNIWQEILETGIEEKVMRTTFMEGIKSGKLDIMCWSRYIVQDLEFINREYKLWQRACIDSANDQEFLRFCKRFEDNDREFYHSIKKYLYISNVDLLDPFRDYIEDKERTYEKNTYHYVAVVNYACLKIYSEVTKKLLPIANKESPYFDWIQTNAEFMFYQDLESAINYYQSFFDREQLKKDIFRFAQREVELFEASCPFYEKKSALKSE